MTDINPPLPAGRGGQRSSTDENGRGLQLVQALAGDWGGQPRAGAAGKTTWFELEHPDARQAADGSFGSAG